MVRLRVYPAPKPYPVPPRLTDLVIDTSKDWLGYTIYNFLFHTATLTGSLNANLQNIIRINRLTFGDLEDVNLYRVAANCLKTDDLFEVAAGLKSWSWADIGDVSYNVRIRADVQIIEFGDRAAAWDVILYRAGVDRLRTDDHLELIDNKELKFGTDISSGIFYDPTQKRLFLNLLAPTGKEANYFTVRDEAGGYIFTVARDGTICAERWGPNFDLRANLLRPAPPATATETLRNTPPEILRARYWNGVASVDRDAEILHRMTSTVPESDLIFRIAGVDRIRIGDTEFYLTGAGINLYKAATDLMKTDDDFDSRSLRVNGVEVLDSARLLKSSRIACVNKGLTAVTVTETTITLKQELAPDAGFFGFPSLEGIHIRVDNPIGTGSVLRFITRALLDDGTECDLHTEVEVAEGAIYDDWFRWIYDTVTNGRTITAIRLYAYAPTYDPATATATGTVNIERVTGIQI